MTIAALQWHTRNAIAVLRSGSRKASWLMRNGRATGTMPVYIVGSQRSGTGMLGECLGQSPEFVNLGESDPRAFQNYLLRDEASILRLIDECRFRHLVFKPLKDSHRIVDLVALREGSKAIWAFRDFLDRINSAVRQFGSHPLEVFGSFVAGNTSAWQMLGASNSVQTVVRSFDIAALNDYDGAALMWWVRNSLYFDRGLHTDPRIRLWSYDRFVRDPQRELERLLLFLDGQYHRYMLGSVHSDSLRKEPARSLNPRVLELCHELYERLDKSLANQPNR